MDPLRALVTLYPILFNLLIVLLLFQLRLDDHGLAFHHGGFFRQLVVTRLAKVELQGGVHVVVGVSTNLQAALPIAHVHWRLEHEIFPVAHGAYAVGIF